MLKLFRQSQVVQYNWIRKHPGQYVALNATLLVAYFGYIMYEDAKRKREIENDAQQTD